MLDNYQITLCPVLHDFWVYKLEILGTIKLHKQHVVLNKPSVYSLTILIVISHIFNFCNFCGYEGIGTIILFIKSTV